MPVTTTIVFCLIVLAIVAVTAIASITILKMDVKFSAEDTD